MICQYPKSLRTMRSMAVLPVIEFLADVPALAGTEVNLVAVTEVLTLAVVYDVFKASTGVDGHVLHV
jgi:hypothetical protein